MEWHLIDGQWYTWDKRQYSLYFNISLWIFFCCSPIISVQCCFYIFNHSHIYLCTVLLFYLQKQKKKTCLESQDGFPLFSNEKWLHSHTGSVNVSCVILLIYTSCLHKCILRMFIIYFITMFWYLLNWRIKHALSPEGFKRCLEMTVEDMV